MTAPAGGQPVDQVADRLVKSARATIRQAFTRWWKSTLWGALGHRRMGQVAADSFTAGWRAGIEWYMRLEFRHRLAALEGRDDDR